MKLRHFGAALLFASASAAAGPPAIHIERSWANAGATSSAAYVTIHNGARAADRLLGASSPAARSVTIHDSQMTGGVMRMRGAGPLLIAAGGKLAMKSGGVHIMLMGLKAPLRPGAKLPLTLRFQRAGLVRTSVPVVAPGSVPAETAHPHGH